MKKATATILVLFLASLIPALVNTYNNATNIYALINVSTLEDGEKSYNPYSNSNIYGIISPGIATWLLLNTDYIYESCTNIKSMFMPECGTSPIIWAGRGVNNRNDKTTKKLLILIEHFIEKGIPLNSSFDGQTAIHDAIMCNSPEYLSMLLKNGADPEIRIDRNGSPFNKLNAFELQEYLNKKDPKARVKVYEILKKYRA